MDKAVTIALVGSATSLQVAAIGFVAAVRAAKIAADRETARAFALKRHEAILEAAKILLDRKNVYQQMLQVEDVGLDLTGRCRGGVGVLRQSHDPMRSTL